MKKNWFMVAAVAIVAMASCDKEFKETLDQGQSGEVVSFTAFVEGAELPDSDSKAILGTSTNNKPQSKWEANDEITIHNGIKPFTFSTKDNNAASARFTYSGTDFTATNGVVAVYPKGSYTIEVANRTVVANIPTAQEGIKNTYAKGSGLAVAYSTTDKLAFKNACALLKFTVNTDNIKSVTISGNNGEKISGEVKVTLNADGTVSKVEPTANSATYVEIWKHDNQLMKVGEVYYVAIIPQDFKYGLKAEVQLTNMSQPKYRVKETIEDYNVERNNIVDLGKISHSTSATIGTGWMMPGGYNSWASALENGSTRFFYEVGDFYVVKNVRFMDTVSGQEAGFKVMKAGAWKGVSTTGNLSLNTWHSLDGNNNAKVSTKDAYDVYITKDCQKVYITKTGTDVPFKMLYLNAGVWNTAGAWYQAWTWSNDNDGRWETFYHLEGNNFATIIRSSVTKVKILRRAANTSGDDWNENNIWNNTADITLNNKNYVSISGWGSGKQSTYNLSTK